MAAVYLNLKLIEKFTNGLLMNTECFKYGFSAEKQRLPVANMEALAKMRSTKTGVVFQGWKRYAEAEEEE